MSKFARPNVAESTQLKADGARMDTEDVVYTLMCRFVRRHHTTSPGPVRTSRLSRHASRPCLIPTPALPTS